jgi:hypothetical protein
MRRDFPPFSIYGRGKYMKISENTSETKETQESQPEEGEVSQSQGMPIIAAYQIAYRLYKYRSMIPDEDFVKIHNPNVAAIQAALKAIDITKDETAPEPDTSEKTDEPEEIEDPLPSVEKVEEGEYDELFDEPEPEKEPEKSSLIAKTKKRANDISARFKQLSATLDGWIEKLNQRWGPKFKFKTIPLTNGAEMMAFYNDYFKELKEKIQQKRKDSKLSPEEKEEREQQQAKAEREKSEKQTESIFAKEAASEDLFAELDLESADLFSENLKESLENILKADVVKKLKDQFLEAEKKSPPILIR